MHPGALQLFLSFLKSDAEEADGLYILGDLFDSWIGDDVDSELAHQVRKGLKALSAHTQIFFQPGNRDFLIGELFAEQSGIQILDEETVIEINDQRVLLMHGDLLCTDDADYQQARKALRNAAFISDFLGKSLEERTTLAAHYRKLSGEATAVKAADIMDVNQQAVLAYMGRHRARYLIHGHTHRPAVHNFKQGDQPCQRQVLASWSDDWAEILQLDYSADKPGILISRYEFGTKNNSGATV